MGGSGGVGGDTAALGGKACEQLTTSLCTSAATCVPSARSGSCAKQLVLELGCGQSSPMSDFGACLQDTQAAAMTCGGLFPDGNLTLPSACFPPVQATALSEAQSKCYDLVDLLCTRSLTCSGAPVTSIDLQSCEDDVTTTWDLTTGLFTGIPCLLASSVGPGYAKCAAAIPTAACVNPGAGGGGGNGPPISTVPACAGAILFVP
jgi:hypothetical protein